MGWFGPSKEEVWRQLSQEIGAEVVQGGFWKGGNKVQSHDGPWTVTLDAGYSDEDGESRTTRLRAPYVNPEGFRFKFYRNGYFDLGKLFGMQDIEVGDPEFDEAFIIKGNDERKVYDLFANPNIRQMIQEQPRSGWWSRTAKAGSVPSSRRRWTSCTSGSSGSSRTWSG
jgi:hypothetical protein